MMCCGGTCSMRLGWAWFWEAGRCKVVVFPGCTHSSKTRARTSTVTSTAGWLKSRKHCPRFRPTHESYQALPNRSDYVAPNTYETRILMTLRRFCSSHPGPGKANLAIFTHAHTSCVPHRGCLAKKSQPLAAHRAECTWPLNPSKTQHKPSC